MRGALYGHQPDHAILLTLHRSLRPNQIVEPEVRQLAEQVRRLHQSLPRLLVPLK